MSSSVTSNAPSITPDTPSTSAALPPLISTGAGRPPFGRPEQVVQHLDVFERFAVHRPAGLVHGDVVVEQPRAGHARGDRREPASGQLAGGAPGYGPGVAVGRQDGKSTTRPDKSLTGVK
ncbi:hypothetical protein ABT120_21035 [Nonomuraea angiospora]|uniref:hypothetical protein n=1 Tax=Nonomuraea angiospora TaxID=46172 RepID=UPI00332B51EE